MLNDEYHHLQGTALQPEYLPIRPRHSDEGRGEHLSGKVIFEALGHQPKWDLDTDVAPNLEHRS